MPEWVLTSIAAAVTTGVVTWIASSVNQGRLVTRIETRMEVVMASLETRVANLDDCKVDEKVYIETVKRIDRLDIDVKDVQRSKVERDRYDGDMRRIDADFQTVRHNIKGAEQRIGQLETRRP